VAAAVALWTAGIAAGESVTLSTEDVALKLGPDGKVESILDRAVGVERIKSGHRQQQWHFCEISAGGRPHAPTSFERRDGVLVFVFGTLNPAVVVRVRVEERRSYLLIGLERVENPGRVEAVRFARLSTRGSTDRTAERMLRYEEGGRSRCLGLEPLDAYTEVQAGAAGAGGYLSAVAHRGLAALAPRPSGADVFAGRRVALFASGDDAASLVRVLSQVEADEGVPLGWAARREPALRQSTIFWSLFDASAEAARRRAIELTRRAGCRKALLVVTLWADRANGYEAAREWGGSATLKAWIAEAHGAGLLVGAHTLPTFAPPNASIAAASSSAVRRDDSGRPWAVPGGLGYQLDLWRGGFGAQARQIARAVSEAGFDYVYADGLEELPEPLWCSTAVAVRELYEALRSAGRAPRWIEGSSHVSGALWPLIAIHGQIDYYLHQATFRSEVDRNVAHMLKDPGNPSPRQLGWAPLCHPRFPETTPDELEYALGRSLAYDVPIVLVMWGGSVESWTHRDANLHMIYLYEKLRLEQYFPAEVRAELRRPGRDQVLFPDGARYRLLRCRSAPEGPRVASVEIGEKRAGPGQPDGAPRPVSVALRALASEKAEDGAWFVSLWAEPRGADGRPLLSQRFGADGKPAAPVALDGLCVVLPGVRPEQVKVCDIRGRAIEVSAGREGVSIPLTTRVYVRLAGDEPTASLRDAILRFEP